MTVMNYVRCVSSIINKTDMGFNDVINVLVDIVGQFPRAKCDFHHWSLINSVRE
jgi:hypothetical protein